MQWIHKACGGKLLLGIMDREPKLINSMVDYPKGTQYPIDAVNLCVSQRKKFIILFNIFIKANLASLQASETVLYFFNMK